MTNDRTTLSTILASTLLAGGGWSSVGMAAEAAGSAPAHAEGALEEVVVTAQKRSQKLSDVPISINAVTGADLASAGVADVRALAKVAPSFQVGQAYNGVPSFSLRGINFISPQISAPPSVSAYVDEAPLPYSVMTEWMLLDVERIEVLKGPQGTLFGQNSTGGSINVIAAKPTDTFKAGIRSEVSNFGQVFAEGYASGPVSDTLRARVAASTTQFGAWQHGYYLTPSSDHNADQAVTSARLLLDWTPIDRLKIAVNLNANYDHGESQAYQVGIVAPVNINNEPFPGAFSYPPATSARQADFTPGFNLHKRDRQYQGTVRMDYELTDDLTLTSLTNYTDFKMYRPLDGDGTFFNGFLYELAGAIRAAGEEVRLSGKALDHRVTYILGASYQDDKIVEGNNGQLLNTSQAADDNERTPLDFHNRTLGVFANLDYEIVPDLTVTGGVRYTQLKQQEAGCSTGQGPVALGIYGFIANTLRAGAGLPATDAYANAGPNGCIVINNIAGTPGGTPSYLPSAIDQRNQEHNISWRGGVNYKITPDTMVYGMVSRGYKAGTYPGAIAIFFQTDLPYVRQEQITSYEVGTKLAMFDHRLQFNAAGFYYQYRDKQFVTYTEVPVVVFNQVLANIPYSAVRGIDVDLAAAPIDGLTLRGAMTYIDTYLGNYFSKTPVIDPQTGKLVAVNVQGRKFNYAPPWTATLDAEYEHPVWQDLRAYVGGGMQYTAKTNADIGGSYLTDIPTYTLLDARFGVRSDKGWTAGLFVRNLTNKYYWTSAARTADIIGRMAGMPRTFGVTAAYSW